MQSGIMTALRVILPDEIHRQQSGEQANGRTKTRPCPKRISGGTSDIRAGNTIIHGARSIYAGFTCAYM